MYIGYVLRVPGIVAAICLLATALILYKRKDTVWPSLSGSSLTVSTSGPDDKAVANQYRWISNGQGVIRFNRMGTKLLGPVLSIGSPRRLDIVGRADISAYLAPAFAERQAVAQGILASLISACLALFVVVNAHTLSRFGLVFSYVGAFATVPLGFVCMSCTSFAAESVVPLIALAAFSLTAIWFSLGLRTTIGHYFIALFGIGGSLVQVALLIQSPKFCVWCLILGTCCVGVAQAALASAGQPQHLIQLTIPRRMRLILMSVIGLAFSRGLLLAFNVISVPTSKVMQFTLVNQRLCDYYPDAHGAGLYMVTSPTCPPCLAAVAFNERNRLKVNEMNICSGLRTTGCFQTGLQTVPTPTYFMVNAEGKVTWEFVGVPSAEMQSVFLSQVRATELKHEKHS